MIATRRMNQKAMQRLFLIPVVSITLIMILTGTSQIRAFGVEGTSTQTSCVNNQPCQTMVCSEGQPCKVSETPNSDFDFEFDNDETDSLSQPLEGTGTSAGTGKGTAGVAPFYDPYNNIYTEDQEEYLEDRQDMMEDAEYE
jgi:hypothetical protein